MVIVLILRTMNREKIANEILGLSMNLILELFPDLRYNQALYALNIVKNEDMFFVSSSKTLKNALPKIKQLLTEYEMDTTKKKLITISIKAKLKKLGLW